MYVNITNSLTYFMVSVFLLVSLIYVNRYTKVTVLERELEGPKV